MAVECMSKSSSLCITTKMSEGILTNIIFYIYIFFMIAVISRRHNIIYNVLSFLVLLDFSFKSKVLHILSSLAGYCKMITIEYFSVLRLIISPFPQNV